MGDPIPKPNTLPEKDQKEYPKSGITKDQKKQLGSMSPSVLKEALPNLNFWQGAGFGALRVSALVKIVNREIRRRERKEQESRDEEFFRQLNEEREAEKAGA